MDYSTAVQGMYVAYFGRSANPEGMNFWVEGLESGQYSENNIATSMGTAPTGEAQELYPFLEVENPSREDIESFINDVYDNLFNRDPDKEGEIFWADALENGDATSGELIWEVMQAAETRYEEGSAINPDWITLNAKIEVADNFTDVFQERGLEWDENEMRDLTKEIIAYTDPSNIEEQTVAIEALVPAHPETLVPAHPETSDDPYTVHLASDVSVSEGDSGTTTAKFTVSLNQAASQEVTVEYTTYEGSATADNDYESTSGSVTFSEGESEKNIEVEVYGDTQIEENETFTVQLSNPSSNAELGTSTATGTIENDDPDYQTLADLSGVYDLTSFTIIYNGLEVDESDADYYDGQMTMYESGIATSQQEISIYGINRDEERSYEIKEDESLLIMNPEGYELSFEYQDGELVTYLQDEPGVDYDIESHWTNISNETPDELDTLGVSTQGMQSESIIV